MAVVIIKNPKILYKKQNKPSKLKISQLQKNKVNQKAVTAKNHSVKKNIVNAIMLDFHVDKCVNVNSAQIFKGQKEEYAHIKALKNKIKANEKNSILNSSKLNLIVLYNLFFI
jgi:hypothetical protein